MSTSVMSGCNFLARSISASRTVGPVCATDTADNTARRYVALDRTTTSIAPRPLEPHTAIPFPEQHVREILAANGELLAGAPHHRRAPEWLTALPVILRRVRRGIRQLRLVGCLVHLRQEIRTTQSRLTVPSPGDQFTMHLGRQSLRDECRRPNPTHVETHVPIHRIHASLAARAPEELSKTKPRRRCYTVRCTGCNRYRVRKQHRVRVQDQRQLVVVPQRIHLGHVCDIQRALL